MSIQTELTRIINAKAAIKTAVEGKGVTVPAGTLLDGMAALIESIQTGGGSATSITGTITLNGAWENVNLLTYEELTNVFGETLPTLFVAIYRTTSCASSHTNGCLWVSNQENAVYLYRNLGTSGFANAVGLSTSTPTITKTQGLIIPQYPSYYFKAGEHYYSVSRYDG